MESTEIGREAKVYERLWSGGNESRSSGFYFPVYTLYMSFHVQEQLITRLSLYNMLFYTFISNVLSEIYMRNLQTEHVFEFATIWLEQFLSRSGMKMPQWDSDQCFFFFLFLGGGGGVSVYLPCLFVNLNAYRFKGCC